MGTARRHGTAPGMAPPGQAWAPGPGIGTGPGMGTAPGTGTRPGTGTGGTCGTSAPPAPSGPARRHGFDTCAAPSLRVMRAWCPEFAAAAVYMGGAESACAQPNLTASWVRAVTRMGWALMPTYVGPQASCWLLGPDRAAHAVAQGQAAAAAAIRRGQQLGMGRGTPIYYDLEGYNSGNARCRTAHSPSSTDGPVCCTPAGTPPGCTPAPRRGRRTWARPPVYGHRLAKPASLWFALWDRGRNLRGGPYLPGDWWPGAHRIKQYLGPHRRTVHRRHGGHRLGLGLVARVPVIGLGNALRWCRARPRFPACSVRPPRSRRRATRRPPAGWSPDGPAMTAWTRSSA